MEAVITELGLVALAAMMSPTTLTFSVLVLVLGQRPLRTGAWFYAGALLATLVVGVAAAFVIGDAASSSKPSTPKTPVAIIDVVAGAIVLVYALRLARRPVDPKRTQDMVAQMSKVANSPAIAIVGAGAMLANPGGFIPIALKTISETEPKAGQYILEWIAFALVSLLPLSVALLALALAREPTQGVLVRVREWLLRHAQTVAAVILVLLAVALLRNGIAGLTS